MTLALPLAPEALLTVRLPLRLVNPLNGQTGNSRLAAVIRARRRAVERAVARVRVLAGLKAAGLSRGILTQTGCIVTLTRVSAGRMDVDGLAASCKGVRDGIADTLGVDDGSPFVRYVYRQRKGPQRHHEVIVEIARA